MTDEIERTIEAFLFSAARPLSARDIQAWLPEEPLDRIQAALERLAREFESLGRSFHLREVAGGFQFRTRTAYAQALLKMLSTSPARLSRAALETLAIIAYKQPIIRHEIERLRGVDTGSILRTLLEKDLVRIVGRKNLPGRPLIYGTTRRFLEVFDLRDLAALPQLKDLQELTTHDEEETSEAPAPVHEAPEETGSARAILPEPPGEDGRKGDP